MLSWRSVCTLALALVLALPATALAQNAGDQQYTDPLAPGESQGGGGGDGSGTPPGSTGSQGSAGSAQAQEPSASAQAQPTQGGDSSELPRTGFPAGVLALAGAGMLAGGAALRRRVT
jgi:LPXTG-motif cell wall-anchored protein